MGVVAKEVKAMSQENILAFEKAGEVIIAGHCLKLTDIKVLILFLLKQYIINISVTICLRFIFKYWLCVCVCMFCLGNIWFLMLLNGWQNNNSII